jgi:hypothetical protein
MKRLLGFLLVFLPLASALAAGPLTSFHPGQVWPDDHGVAINAHGGGFLFYQGVYYWFGEHKVAGPKGNSAQVGVHAYSSNDLYNWRDEGIALPVSDDPASDITRGCILERPKVIYNARTGKFVMWFHLELHGHGYDSARAGVAVASRPAGPYQYVGSFRLNPGIWPVKPEDPLSVTTGQPQAPAGAWNVHLIADIPGGQMSRDMTLFVDDDGTAYQIAASEANSTIHITRLTPDYLHPDTRYVRVFPGGYNEAPAMFKHAGKYYLFTSGCSGWSPNAARSAVADSIWGPWKPLGNPCIGTPSQVSKTFGGQSTYILPVAGRPDACIFMADIWHPWNPIDGRYAWLPIEWQDGRPRIEWKPEWDLNAFGSIPFSFNYLPRFLLAADVAGL